MMGAPSHLLQTHTASLIALHHCLPLIALCRLRNSAPESYYHHSPTDSHFLSYSCGPHQVLSSRLLSVSHLFLHTADIHTYVMWDPFSHQVLSSRLTECGMSASAAERCGDTQASVCVCVGMSEAQDFNAPPSE